MLARRLLSRDVEMTVGFLESQAVVLADNRQIVTALRARDPEAIRTAIGVHLDKLGEDIIDVIQQELDANGPAPTPSTS